MFLMDKEWKKNETINNTAPQKKSRKLPLRSDYVYHMFSGSLNPNSGSI